MPKVIDRRKWLARQLGLSPTSARFNDLWAHMEERGDLRIVLDEDWEGIVTIAQDLLDYEGRRGAHIARERTQQTEISPTLTEAESHRANALMLYWARNAACERQVRGFRKRVLPNRLLTRPEALSFLSSPALAFFSQHDCEREGIPLIGHTARVISTDVERNRDGWLWQRALWVDPPGIEFERVRLTTDPLEHFWHPPASGEYAEGINVWPMSVLDDLRRISDDIADRYGWGKAQTSFFILTNITPLTHALSYTREEDALGRSKITMTIDPWVTKQTVLRAYQQAQQKIYSRTPGPMSKKNAALFESVIEHMDDDDDGTLPAWRSLMTAWNRQQTDPEWKYEDPRTFERDYQRAKKALLFPAWREPEPISLEEMQPARAIAEAFRRHSDSHLDSHEGQ